MYNRSNEWTKKKRQEELANNPDAIECLICGKRYIQVCTHIVQVHGMTAKEYKDKFGLWRRGIIKGKYKEKKSRITLENKSYVHLPEAGKNTRIKKGDSKRYKRGYSQKFTKKILN